ncbi:Rieske 2Fe-2S domain-containing protein [Acidiferrimicrobium sp. IK]|uniref:Rieske 2Fe-2S domain-containing protein n=1 Tax=Acidiferrimicrobium sp. IK TaxID=2871700 RepID=UPI0021CAFD23|nr:Rieske 2Fe-2S domain-containing protein [Acidiferrimicrobium sp. IK]MCU4187511.1 Rieske 2Fe-2S domain-containing protein [Acidiferrimicrobium sp. IK]
MSEIRIPVSDVKPGTAVRLDVTAGGVCLVRIEDSFYAIGDRCSHANVSLSEGQIDPDERWIECWKHGSAFSLEDGQPQSLPAVAPVPVYEVVVEGDEVVVRY